MTLEEQKTQNFSAESKSQNASEDARANSDATPNTENPPAKKSPLWDAIHWTVKFALLGWVVNAILSVKIYDQLHQRFPNFMQNCITKSQGVFDAIGRKAGSENWSAVTKQKFSTLGKDFVDVCGTGIGGFLVVPLIAVYASFQKKITKFFQHKQDDEPREKESISHWTAARVLGFSSAVGLYMAIKYMAGKSYTSLNDKAVKWATNTKWIPNFMRPSSNEVSYYLAEQVAAITSTTILSLSKDSLDKHFPPEKVEPEKEASPAPARKILERRPSATHTGKITEKRAAEEASAGMGYASV